MRYIMLRYFCEHALQTSGMGSDRLSFLPRRLEITSAADKLVCHVGFGALMAVALLSSPVQGNLVLSQVALFFWNLFTTVKFILLVYTAV
jgi:hypothetical protein